MPFSRKPWGVLVGKRKMFENTKGLHTMSMNSFSKDELILFERVPQALSNSLGT